MKKNRLPRVNACDLHHETVVLASLREREAERQERLRLARVAKGIFK